MKLTDEQIQREDAFLKGLPRINWGALLMPPIWGPAHGFWVTVLYYPAWLVADNVFYGAFQEQTVLSFVIAALTFVLLLGITIAFAIVAQPIAAHRAEDRGISRADYLKRQRIWAIASALIGLVMIGLATYYNLEVRPHVAS